jgi:zinc protease
MKSNKLLKIAGVLFLIPLWTSTINAQITKTASVEGITEYKLDSNGMKVLLFPDNSSQTITVNITYKVGSRHEGYGEKGMAHLLEHLVFKGTPNHPNIPKELSDHGARPNGTTWYDRTNYFETFNATDENLDWALDLEADRMVNSYIAKKDLESEFSVVRNEFESGENSPTSVLMKSVISSGFLWHNYGQSTIGNRSDIERVPIENLKAFYKKYYRPDNAVLMVTGKFNTEKTLKLIEEKFGKIKNPSAPLKYVPTIEPPQDGEKRVVLNRVGDLQVLSAMYHTPAGSDKDHAALAIVENVLTDQPSGRLYKALIDGKKASSMWSFAPFTKEPSFMYFNIDVPSDKSLVEAENTMLGLFDNLSKNPITEEELKRAKSNLLKQQDRVFRNSSYLGTYMSEFIGAGDWRLAFIFRDRIEKMTLADVNAAMSKYFIKTNRTVGNFVPTKNPERVAIPHTEGVDELVKSYKGKKALGTGEAFDVSYNNIEKRLNTGTLPKSNIEYGFIKKDNRGKTVSVSFTFRNGAEKDLMNKGLVARYTASMMNKGTANRTRQQIEDELSAIKSSVSIRGGNGRTYVNISSTEENLPKALELMTDMLKNPKFDEAELEKIKTRALANLERNKTEPTFLASRKAGQINQKYKKGHPLYRMSIEEEIQAVKDVTVDKLKSYYKDFYGISNNATLIAIGNMDEEKLKGYFEENFGDFKSKLSFTPVADKYSANKAANESIKTPDKKNAFTTGSLSFECSQDDEDYAALQVAGEIFGGGFLNSRIANRLRQKDGVSYGAGGGVSVDGDNKDKNSVMYIYAIYAPQNAAKVQKGFQEEIKRFIEGGVTQEELDGVIKGWVQAKAVSRAKDRELSGLINNNLYYDRDFDFHRNLEAKVKKLTVEDVNRVIKKYFKNYEKWTVVNAGDFKNMAYLKDKMKN